jgi:hypothetical protein
MCSGLSVKNDAASSFEILVPTYQTTQCYSPQGDTIWKPPDGKGSVCCHSGNGTYTVVSYQKFNYKLACLFVSCCQPVAS